MDLYQITALQRCVPRDIAEEWSLKKIEGYIQKYKRLLFVRYFNFVAQLLLCARRTFLNLQRMEEMPKIEGRDVSKLTGWLSLLADTQESQLELDKLRVKRGEEPISDHHHTKRVESGLSLFALSKAGSSHVPSLSHRQMKRYGLSQEAFRARSELQGARA